MVELEVRAERLLEVIAVIIPPLFLWSTVYLIHFHVVLESKFLFYIISLTKERDVETIHSRHIRGCPDIT